MDRQLTTEELRTSKPQRDEYSHLIKHPISVILDNVMSSYNIGSIIRASEALLLESLSVCGDHDLPSYKRLKKASCGAEKWLKVNTGANTRQECKRLKAEGFRIIAVELSEKSLDYREAIYQYPSCFVFGSEQNGVSDEVLSYADQVIHIPMFGMANSINVSSAASIILADAVRQIHAE